MHDGSPRELELTPDLLDYAKAVALTGAQKRCPKHVDYGDVVQDALLHLISKPTKYDPARGASPKTLIYTIVQRAVLKSVGRECKQAKRFKQSDEAKDGGHADPQAGITENRAFELTKTQWTTDDMLEFIDNEDSRALCRLVIECDGNVGLPAFVWVDAGSFVCR